MLPSRAHPFPDGDPPHFFTTSPHTRPLNTKESAAPTTWSVISIVHCITGTMCAPPGHTSTQHPPNGSPGAKLRPSETNTCDTTCPHSVCSHTLIGTYVTYAPDVTVAPLWSIPRHGAHPERIRGLCSSGTSRQMGPQRFPRRLDCDWERPRFHNERTSRTQRGGMRRARL